MKTIFNTYGAHVGRSPVTLLLCFVFSWLQVPRFAEFQCQLLTRSVSCSASSRVLTTHTRWAMCNADLLYFSHVQWNRTCTTTGRTDSVVCKGIVGVSGLRRYMYVVVIVSWSCYWVGHEVRPHCTMECQTPSTWSSHSFSVVSQTAAAHQSTDDHLNTRCANYIETNNIHPPWSIPHTKAKHSWQLPILGIAVDRQLTPNPRAICCDLQYRAVHEQLLLWLIC